MAGKIKNGNTAKRRSRKEMSAIPKSPSRSRKSAAPNIPKSKLRNPKSDAPHSEVRNPQLAALRKKAEKELKEQTGRLHKLSAKGVEDLIHELGTHQIELEMQNEELRRAQEELEASRSKYSDLYDFAPIGYFTFDTKGQIHEVNLTGASMLGVERLFLVKRLFSPYISRTNDKNVFYNHLREVFKKHSLQTCVIRLKRKNGPVFYAQLQSMAVEASEDSYCRTTISDITEKKTVEEELIKHKHHLGELVEERSAELKKANEKLQQQIIDIKRAGDEIKRFASFPQLDPNPVLEVDSSGIIVFSNAAAVLTLKKVNLGDSKVFLPHDITDILKALKKEDEVQIYREVKINDRIFAEALYVVPQYNSVRIYANDVTERRQAEETLQHSEEYFRLLMENTSDAVTILDGDGIIRYESLSVERMLGYKPDELVGTSAFDLIHPDDLSDVTTIFSYGARNAGIVLSAQFRCKHKDGSWRFLDAMGKNLLDNSAIRGIVINSRDITESMQAAQALRSERQRLINILDSMVDGVYIVSQQNEIEYVNPILEREYGPVNGRKCHDYFEGRKKACTWCKNQEVFKGKTVRSEWYSEKTNKTYDLINTPLKNPDGGVSKLGIFRDITDRKQAEEALKKVNRTLRALSNSNQAMLHADSETEFLKEVCGIIVEDCGHAMVWIGFAEDNEGKTVRPIASAGFEKGYLETLNITWADTERGRGPTGMAIRTGKPSICRNMLTDPAFEPWREEAIKRGYASSIVLPLMAGGKVFGAINIYSREPDPFTEDEVKLLSELTGDLSYGILAMRSRVAHAEAQEAVRESEELFRATFEQAAVGIEMLTLEGQFLRGNDMLGKILGFSHEEIRKLNFNEISNPDDLVREQPLLEDLLTGRADNYTIEKRYHHKGGQSIWVRVTSSLVNTPSPYRVSIIEDITERKRAEERLREAKELSDGLNRVNEIIGSSLNADEIMRRMVVEAGKAIGCDSAAISLRKNDRWKVTYIFGLPQELVGTEMVDEEEPHAMLALESRKPVAVDDAYNDERVNGEHMKKYGIRSVLVIPLFAGDESLGVVFLNYHSLPVQFTAAQVDFAGKLGMSVSLALEKSRLLSALKLRSSELEVVNRELEAFSYTVSHDLKTPLRSIQGFAQAITEDYEDRLDDAGRDSLRRINSAGERMTQLIDAMLEISRLTSRDLMNKSVDLTSIAEVIAYDLKKKEPNRMVHFIIAKEVKVQGDEDLLEIALRNLFDNAWKFTSKHASAKIEFGATQMRISEFGMRNKKTETFSSKSEIKEDSGVNSAPRNPKFEIDGRNAEYSEIQNQESEMEGKTVYFIKDDGVGFNMEFADDLFMPFKRLHLASEFPGLGIGLATVKKIINKHGGKIWAEGEPEKGATFYFTLG
jgi:PAS domain S-box-containing protein